MAVNPVQAFAGVSKAITFPRLIAALDVEQTYLKSLTTYPQSLQQVTQTGYTITRAAPTTFGKGYKFFVPSTVDFSATMLMPFISTTATTVVTGSAKGVVFGAPMTISAANGYNAGYMIPYLECAIELNAVETSPDYTYGYYDLVVDSAVVTTAWTGATATGAYLDVAPPVLISDSANVQTQGLGRLKAYRFYNPMQKSATISDIFQVRVAYPAVANASATVPAGKFVCHLSGTIIVPGS